MRVRIIYPWQQAPLIRLLVPFIAGILLQWYCQLPLSSLVITGAISFILLISFFLLPFFHRYKLSFINGLTSFLLFVSLGAILSYTKDIRHDKYWFGHSCKDSTALLVTLDEQPIEKTKSIKAEAIVSYRLENNSLYSVKGKIIIYFEKDSLANQLAYGTQLILKKPLQEITNAGNPGAFDYKRYSLFQQITHQVYLKTGEYTVLNTSGGTKWKRAILSIQEKTLAILKYYIKGEKETGLAEALLIGYKNDLDKRLTQSYSNTGVIHVIAISGLHLGLIYWILVRLCRPLQKRKRWKWLRLLLIISLLWMFSCIAGAQPSVIRSALMLTCIIAGETFTRKTNIYNTLALSAFLLLCYNPYWLWDIGFQLSYAAVLSLVLFMRPIYHLLYFENKLLDITWKLNAATFGAQLLTLPFSIYYSHQFPNYLLLTNLVAIPLSSIILVAEIFLCAISFVPFIALFTGKLTTWLIGFMNTFIEWMERLPFSLWQSLQISVTQTILFTCFILCISYWLIYKSRPALKAGLITLLSFIILRSISFIQTKQQEKIIVYNIPQKQAIDLIQGHHYFFIGDSSVEQDLFTYIFYLRPSRIMHRVGLAQSLNNYYISGNHITVGNKHILLLNKSISFSKPDSITPRQTIHLLILSGNPRIYISRLVQSLDIRQVIIDASVPAWKSRYWKKDCDSLDIPWHDVTLKGAFAMNLR